LRLDPGVLPATPLERHDANLVAKVTHVFDLLTPFVERREPLTDDPAQLVATVPNPPSTLAVASPTTSASK
jgi:hypothetical protein